MTFERLPSLRDAPEEPWIGGVNVPVIDSKALELFVEGDVLYDAMLDEIGRATRSVRLESYILSSDATGDAFVKAVSQCATRGIDVRLRTDHVGSGFDLKRADIARMRAAGVRFEWSRAWSLRAPLSLNRRNHRKLLVVDEAVAFVGGFNIHSPSSQRAVGAARWRDSHVRFMGAAAAAAATVFDCYRDVQPDWLPPKTASPWLLPNRSRACRHRLRCVFHDTLRAAKSRIWATTPYFVPDSATQKLLCDAALDECDVRLLVPGKSDVPLAQWAARAAYSNLLSCGVRIFEYMPRVLHSKTLLVDAAWATVGTANLDYRSFFVNDELNLIDETGELNTTLADVFLRDIDDASEVLAAPWSRRSASRRIAEAVGWWARRWL